MKRLLNDFEKKEILTEHIPYKLTQLRHHHHYKRDTRNLLEPHGLYRMHEICAIEIAFVAGRLFLEFLAIAYDKNNRRIKERTAFQDDDLLITDFGCQQVKLSDLTENEIQLLSTFYNRANKGSGHFTWEKREIDGYESIDEGTVIIERLLRTHLYDKLDLSLVEKRS